MFRTADLVVLTKIDLLPHLLNIDLHALEVALARVMPEPALLQVSAVTGEGIDRWLAWLERLRHRVLRPAECRT
jgi:hydrogenase nickel incorporation protein HypB